MQRVAVLFYKYQNHSETLDFSIRWKSMMKFFFSVYSPNTVQISTSHILKQNEYRVHEFTGGEHIPPLNFSQWGHLHRQEAPGGQPSITHRAQITCTLVHVIKAPNLPCAFMYGNLVIDASPTRNLQPSLWWQSSSFWGHFKVFLS